MSTVERRNAIALDAGRLSDWITADVPGGARVKVRGICRMLLTEMGEHVSLYVSPINMDPEQPAMPISHPSYYATYLAKRIGPYSTLGLAEDTWALNEGVIDDGTFLQQTYDIDASGSEMFFAGARSAARGAALVCVFDATDRIQHMFWRYLDPTHPRRARGASPRRIADAIEAAVRAQRRARRPRSMRAASRRRADGAVGPRLQLVPPRRQPQSLAAAITAILRSSPAPTARPSGCATWTGRGRGPTRSA